MTVRAMYVKNAASSLNNTQRASTDSLPVHRHRNCMTSLSSASRLYFTLPPFPIVGQMCVLKCASRPCATQYVMFSLCIFVTAHDGKSSVSRVTIKSLRWYTNSHFVGTSSPSCTSIDSTLQGILHRPAVLNVGHIAPQGVT